MDWTERLAMTDKINERIRRIYAAIDEAVTTDASGFKSETRHVGGNKFVTGMDFGGGLTKEQLQNTVFTAVHNVANLSDHLKKWARQNNKNANTIDQIVNDSPELKVIIDLFKSG